MSERIYYCICDDDCKYPTFTAEQILAAIAEATGSTPQSVDDAFISKVKELQNGDTLQFWKGTEAQFNALNPAPSTHQTVVRLGADGIIYLCDNDGTIQNIYDRIEELQNKKPLMTEAEGVLPIANGGTGLDANPAMLVNLASTATDTPLKASPRPGVTGVLPVSSGGSGMAGAQSYNFSSSSQNFTGDGILRKWGKVVEYTARFITNTDIVESASVVRSPGRVPTDFVPSATFRIYVGNAQIQFVSGASEVNTGMVVITPIPGVATLPSGTIIPIHTVWVQG